MVIDFATSSQLRTFELLLKDHDGRTQRLWVNPHYLAEISPYFHALCFANFRECQQNRCSMDDVFAEDMQELLRCVCPDENFTLEQNIRADNFAALIYLSSRLLLQNLRRELERIAADADSTLLNVEASAMPQLVDTLIEAYNADFPDRALRELCRRVGQFKKDEVMEHLRKSSPPHVADALEHSLQSYFYQAVILCPPQSSYNWSSHHIRLFF